MGGGLLPRSFEFPLNLKNQRALPLFKKGMLEKILLAVSKVLEKVVLVVSEAFGLSG